jgi:hypothetical protein
MSGEVEHGRDLAMLAHVDVGREEVDRRRGGLPDIEDVVGRAAARVGEGVLRIDRVSQRRVDVHRQGVHGLPRRRHLLDEAADVPGVEELVGVRSKHLGPAPRSAAHRLHEVGGDRPPKQTLGGR